MKIKIVGHRANHMQRLEYYLNLGVDYVEVDFNISFKGKAIAYHGDPLTSTTTLTEAIIRKMMSHVLKKDNIFMPVPIDDIVEKTKKRTGLWIDVKTRIPPYIIMSYLRKIVELNRDYLVDKPVIIGSNYLPLLKELLNMLRTEKILDYIRISFTLAFEPVDYSEIGSIMKKIGASIISLEYPYLTEDLSSWIRKNNFELAVWTVNSPAKIKEIKRYTPDFIVTDRPEFYRQAL